MVKGDLTFFLHVDLEALFEPAWLTLVSPGHIHNAVATLLADIVQVPARWEIECGIELLCVTLESLKLSWEMTKLLTWRPAFWWTSWRIPCTRRMRELRSVSHLPCPHKLCIKLQLFCCQLWREKKSTSILFGKVIKDIFYDLYLDMGCQNRTLIVIVSYWSVNAENVKKHNFSYN